MKKCKEALAILVLLVLLVPFAIADDTSKIGAAANSDSSTSKNWEFSLAPLYLWAASIDGDQTVKGKDVDLDVSFSDIFDNLDGALTFHFEGIHRQRWGFLTDLNYIVLGMDDGPVDIDFTEIMFELAGFYRITKGAHAIDGLGGLRYTSMDVELDLPGPLPDLDERKDWVDPFIGLRWQWNFAEKWGTKLRSDIGGFGIGSDLTWNLAGLVDFKPWEHVGLFGGYRVLYQDYSSGSGDHKFAYDATMYGPVLGLNITW
jgi:hypothetical protein